MSPDEGAARCEACGADRWGSFVQHGSFIVRCLECRTPHVATSYLAVGRTMTGRRRAVLVDERFEELEVVAEGSGAEIYEAVKRAADKGGLVWLQDAEERPRPLA